MKLSTKLKLSFCLLILVPVFLSSIALVGISSYKLRELKNNFNVSDTSYEALANPVVLVSDICKSQYNKILDTAGNEPEKFSDPEFLEGINSELTKRCSFLIVVDGGQCVYSGNEMSEEILSKLSAVSGDAGRETGFYLGGDYHVVINKVNYTGTSGNDGQVYIVMQVAKLVPQLRRMLIDGIIALGLVVILTSGFFTTWMYRETVSPINKLRLATNNIKNGNLDFDMDIEGKDEFSELCRDFDDMRKRLKENAEEKLKNDNESKELISNISHDLKTPITAIKGYVEGIMDGVVNTPEKMDKYIRTIYNKACDMDRLIDELTFYSKIDTNKIPYNFVRINVYDYFTDCIAEKTIEFDSMGIRFKNEINVMPGTRMVADPEQLKRVIDNILSNSVKYSDSNKSVTIISMNVREDDKWVYLDIQDNGQGIAENDIDFIFDRFYRSDSSRSSTNAGSGIGLSIVKKIVTDHGGTIKAESVPGEGTTMHVTLPKYKQVREPVRRLSD